VISQLTKIFQKKPVFRPCCQSASLKARNAIRLQNHCTPGRLPARLSMLPAISYNTVGRDETGG
jgi:hypothetical protein